MNKFVSEWEQVIPYLPPHDIKRLEDILKQVQKQNEKQNDSTTIQSQSENVTASSSGNNNVMPSSSSSSHAIVETSVINNNERSSQLSANSSQRPASSCKEEMLNSRSTSPSASDVSSTTAANKGGGSTSIGKTFETGRRNLKDENVNDDEAKRRAKRRERNRIAAAMCRKRRQDHISHLQVKVNKMKAITNQLSEHLQVIIKEKSILHSLLLEHKCVMQISNSSSSSSNNTNSTSSGSKIINQVAAGGGVGGVGGGSGIGQNSLLLHKPPSSPSSSGGGGGGQHGLIMHDKTIFVNPGERPSSLPIPMSVLDQSSLLFDQMETPFIGTDLTNLTPLMTPGVWSTLKESILSSGIINNNNNTSAIQQSTPSTSSLRLDYSEISREPNYLGVLSPTKILHKSLKNNKDHNNLFFPIVTNVKNDSTVQQD